MLHFAWNCKGYQAKNGHLANWPLRPWCPVNRLRRDLRGLVGRPVSRAFHNRLTVELTFED
jgi:hypothetical protein